MSEKKRGAADLCALVMDLDFALQPPLTPIFWRLMQDNEIIGLCFGGECSGAGIAVAASADSQTYAAVRASCSEGG